MHDQPLSLRIAGAASFLGITVIAMLGILILTFEPALTISIQDCGSREYFMKKLNEQKIRYVMHPNGDFGIYKDDIDKYKAQSGGNLASRTPDASRTGTFKNCPF